MTPCCQQTALRIMKILKPYILHKVTCAYRDGDACTCGMFGTVQFAVRAATPPGRDA